MTKHLFSKIAKQNCILLLLLLYGVFNNVTSIYVVNANEIQSARIVSGTTTNIQNAKYTVYLRVNGKFICGGSLVTVQFVITAAHCVKNLNPSQLTIVGGATYLSDSGVRRSVHKIITPKEYNSKTYHMDIAVVKLSGNMSGKNIATIELCKASWKLGDSIDVYGWGAMSESNNRESNQLRTVKVPLVARSKCKDMYKRDGTITETMFCAGDLKGKDSCSGDSGGPAVFQKQLCGVVSWGVGCARTNYPGVYTYIKTVRNFIDRAMKL